MRNATLPVFSTRPHLWLRPAQPLVCPNLVDGYPHKIRTNWLSLRDGEDDAVTCQFKRQADAAECGAVVYVLSLPGGMRFTARVLFQELKQLRGKHAHEILAYLGSTNPFARDTAPERSPQSA